MFFLCGDTLPPFPEICFWILQYRKSIFSGPCSIEKVYPCEWRIAIPASLMWVEKGVPDRKLMTPGEKSQTIEEI